MDVSYIVFYFRVVGGQPNKNCFAIFYLVRSCKSQLLSWACVG